MKFLMGLLLITGNVFGADLNLGCVTEQPTTTVIAQTNNNLTTFEIYHHNGVKFMPIHNGVITPYDLDTMTKRANILADLGNHLTFSLEAKKCESNDLLFNCFGHSEVKEINGHKVYLWAAHSTQYDETSFAGTFSYVTTNIALDVDGETFWVPMKYYAEECYKDFAKKKLLPFKK